MEGQIASGIVLIYPANDVVAGVDCVVGCGGGAEHSSQGTSIGIGVVTGGSMVLVLKDTASYW